MKPGHFNTKNININTNCLDANMFYKSYPKYFYYS